jgi:hypothetical protein
MSFFDSRRRNISEKIGKTWRNFGRVDDSKKTLSETELKNIMPKLLK